MPDKSRPPWEVEGGVLRKEQGYSAGPFYLTKISVLSGGGGMIGVRVILGKVASVMLTAKVLGPSLV